MLNNISLYRKYRPKNFEEMSGQNQIIKVLKNALIKNKITHAYLFSGPRGTGKTSTAKIIGKLFNCLEPIDGKSCDKCISCTAIENNDIIELDAASNNGVDEIRNIISKVNFSPNYGKYKVYIIDEVHMLSVGAFNALLKTLEEPPAHVIFILATTEIHKIPQTILSRCQRYDFQKITSKQMLIRLKYIAEQEKINITEDALIEIAESSDGAMRDAISLLEKISLFSDNEIIKEDVLNITGGVLNEQIKYFLGNIILGNIKETMLFIDKLEETGKNYLKICDLLLKTIKDEMILNLKKESNLFECNKVNTKKIFLLTKTIQDSMLKIKGSLANKIIFELMILELISICNVQNEEKQSEKIVNTIKETNKIDNVPVSNEEILKEIKTQTKEKKVDEILMKCLPETIINIRISNCLSKASKQLKQDFIVKLEKISEISDLNILNMIRELNVMVVSDEYVIFTSKYASGAYRINENYQKIEKIILEECNLNLRIVAVSDDHWETIKKEYTFHKGKFSYAKEPKIEEKKELNKLEKLLGTDIVQIKEEG